MWSQAQMLSGFFAHIAPGLEGAQQQVGGDFYYARREPLGILCWYWAGITHYKSPVGRPLLH